MATPDTITIGNLNNEWVLNKRLTGDLGPLLKRQGVSWIIRKTVPAITITVHVREYPSVDPGSNESMASLDLTQKFSGGFLGTTERRTMDWQPREHSDYLFGSVLLQARYIGGRPDESGAIRPAIQLEPEMQHEEGIQAWLLGATTLDGEQQSGFLMEPSHLWIYTAERKAGGGLSAQVWGFELIDSVRHLSRRIVVMDSKGRYTCGRLVYDFCK